MGARAQGALLGFLADLSPSPSKDQKSDESCSMSELVWGYGLPPGPVASDFQLLGFRVHSRVRNP